MDHDEVAIGKPFADFACRTAFDQQRPVVAFAACGTGRMQLLAGALGFDNWGTECQETEKNVPEQVPGRKYFPIGVYFIGNSIKGDF
ncbi:MAG: hypothetical protein GY765_35370 [bacterium]|nr:hypothetical protein [bacterium]